MVGTPMFSSWTVPLLAGLTGTKPAPPLGTPDPLGEGPGAGAAPNSPAVERMLTGLASCAIRALSKLL